MVTLVFLVFLSHEALATSYAKTSKTVGDTKLLYEYTDGKETLTVHGPLPPNFDSVTVMKEFRDGLNLETSVEDSQEEVRCAFL